MDRLTLGHICLEFIVCKLYTEKGVGTSIILMGEFFSHKEYCHTVNFVFTPTQ